MLSPERKQSLASKATRYALNLDERVISYLASRGITEQVANMFNLGTVPQGDDYAGRLSIPYMVPHGGCVDIKYRLLGDEGNSKYLKEPGVGLHLFNAQVLKDASICVLTEGELDAICVQAYCGIPAVAYPGTNSWMSEKNDFWPLCFEGIRKVIVIADGDAPGRVAAQKVADTIGWSARVVDLGDGIDANEFIASHGEAAFRERIMK